MNKNTQFIFLSVVALFIWFNIFLNFISLDVGAYISIIVSVIIILIQNNFFLKSKNECKELQNLFPDFNLAKDEKLLVIENYTPDFIPGYPEQKGIKYLKISEKYKNSINPKFKEIIFFTNNYLKHNSNNSLDFNIIKDIAERVSQSEENKIQASIALPLYIGLMGTFFGVIIGIFNIVFSSDGIKDSIISENSIQSFLGGVLIAMSGSLNGLILTTRNNVSNFKLAKTIRDKNKNLYLNYLQVELLPSLENTFSYNFKSLKENLDKFNLNLSSNLFEFNNSIQKISENIKLQTDFIKEFQKLDIPRLTNANLKIFKQIDKSSKILDDFNNYVSSLSQQFEKSDLISTKINDLLNRFSDFENNIKNIGVLVKESEENYGKIGEFIFEKLSSLKNRYDLIKQFIEESEDEIKKIATLESDKIKSISQKIVEELDNNFHPANPNNPLSNLNLLVSINSNLEKFLEDNKRNLPHSNNNELLLNAINELRLSIDSLKSQPKQSSFSFLKFLKSILKK